MRYLKKHCLFWIDNSFKL